MFWRAGFIVAVLAILCTFHYKRSLFPHHNTERRTWVTLLATNDYLPGIQALARSLKRAHSIYPLVVLLNKAVITDENYQAILDEGCIVRFIDELNPTSQVNIAFPQFEHVWNKLRAFEIIDICDRCVFMDGDIVVLKNMDELFDLDDKIEFGAVQTCSCNFRRVSTYPKNWKSENCPYTYEENRSLVKSDHSELVVVFNSGVFLYRPDLSIFNQMLEALNTWDLTEFRFADQDFLNKFYENRWTRLPFMYNAVKLFTKSHPSIWDLSTIKAVHFVISKPWNKNDKDNSNYESINHLWWDAYNWRETDQ